MPDMSWASHQCSRKGRLMNTIPPSFPPIPRLLRKLDPNGSQNVLDTLSTSALLEELLDSVLVTDVAGVVQFINLSAVCLLGVPRTEAHGRPVRTLLKLLDNSTHEPVADPLAYLFARTDASPSGRYELLVRHDGATIPIDYTISPIRGDKQTIAGMVLLLRDASRPCARVEQLADAVRHDEHTRLLRRGELERRLARVLQNMKDGDHHALLFMDLDHFKAINDSAGHLAGDKALSEVAELFRAQVRERDTLARLGGDEFGLLLEHCPLALARERAKALQVALADFAFEAEGRSFALGVSIGIVSIRSGRHDVRGVIAAADTSCYVAKRNNNEVIHIAETILE